MYGVNLSNYAKNLLFFENLGKENHYDVVLVFGVDDSDNFLKNVSYVDVSILIVENEIKKYGSVQGVLDFVKENYVTPLLILQQAGMQQLIKVKLGNISVLNLYTGFAGVGNKISPDFSDIDVMRKRGFSVLEPYDLSSFTMFLKQKGKKYIRLQSIDVPGKLFPDDKNVNISPLYSLTNKEFSGLSLTVLGVGSFLGTLIHSHHILQQNGVSFDLFGILDYNFKISSELHHSALSTERLVIIWDQKKGSDYEVEMTKKFHAAGLKNIEIGFVGPDYEQLTTVLDDFKNEQLSFDQYGLAKILGGVVLN